MEGNIVMNSYSAKGKLADYTRLHLQSIRRLHVTVEVLDKNDRTLDVLQGISTGGNLSIDAKAL